LKALSEDATWSRKHLAAEIARMAGSLGKGDSYAVILRTLGESAGVAQLLPVYEELRKEFDERFSVGRARVGPPAEGEQNRRPGMTGLLGRLAGGNL
jgi:hypothetical protein